MTNKAVTFRLKLFSWFYGVAGGPKQQMKEGHFKIMFSLIKYLLILLSTGFWHGRIRHQITHQMMYGFAFIRAQCGPWEEETEMTVVRVGSLSIRSNKERIWTATENWIENYVPLNFLTNLKTNCVWKYHFYSSYLRFWNLYQNAWCFWIVALKSFGLNFMTWYPQILGSKHFCLHEWRNCALPKCFVHCPRRVSFCCSHLWSVASMTATFPL